MPKHKSNESKIKNWYVAQITVFKIGSSHESLIKNFFQKIEEWNKEILVIPFLNLKHVIESGVSVMLNFVYYVFKGKQLK